MQSTRLLKSIAVIVMIVMLSACGFALRGAIYLPFQSIYVGLPESSPLGGELKRYIHASGSTQVAKHVGEADVVLDVLSESREKTILSLNSQGRVREFNLIYNFRFRVRDKAGKEVLEPTQISLKRNISFKEN